MWLSPPDSNGGRSTLDLFGRGFTLLCFGDASDGDVFQSAAAARHLPLDIIHINERAIGNAYEGKLVLVRPDGHVAWRSDAPPRDVGASLDLVTGF